MASQVVWSGVMIASENMYSLQPKPGASPKKEIENVVHTFQISMIAF